MVSRLYCMTMAVSFTFHSDGKVLGNYGAFSDFDFEGCSADEAANRVREMSELGIREFQFYDVIPSYTPQNSATHPQWQILFGNNDSACWTAEKWLPSYTRSRSICRPCVANLIQAIHNTNGRAWLYAQSVAADAASVNYSSVVPSCSGEKCLANWVHTSTGAHACIPSRMDGDRLFYCYQPTGEWGTWQASQYVNVATLMGFDGIHWDSLGTTPCGGVDTASYILENGYKDFLSNTSAVLTKYGLKQTLNFVNNLGYDKTKVETLLEFNYVECWGQGCIEEFGSNNGAGEHGGAVIAYYPCKNDTFFLDMFGWAAKYGNSYLVVADGLHYLANEYFPNAIMHDIDAYVQTRLGIIVRECGPAQIETTFKLGLSNASQQASPSPPPTSCHTDFPTPTPNGTCHTWGC
eukprot:m.141547 g.141547  ORF g.141547 m.141547 type:complete len:407 (+) comp30192_c0_seq15:554-1774(+)